MKIAILILIVISVFCFGLVSYLHMFDNCRDAGNSFAWCLSFYKFYWW